MTPEEVREKAYREADERLRQANETNAALQQQIERLEEALRYAEIARDYAVTARSNIYELVPDEGWQGSSRERFFQEKSGNVNDKGNSFINLVEETIEVIKDKIRECENSKDRYSEYNRNMDRYWAEQDYNIAMGIIM